MMQALLPLPPIQDIVKSIVIAFFSRFAGSAVVYYRLGEPGINGFFFDEGLVVAETGPEYVPVVAGFWLGPAV
jgi:hypothetical protein